jgi:hypothetical protein
LVTVTDATFGEGCVWMVAVACVPPEGGAGNVAVMPEAG